MYRYLLMIMAVLNIEFGYSQTLFNTNRIISFMPPIYSPSAKVSIYDFNGKGRDDWIINEFFIETIENPRNVVLLENSRGVIDSEDLLLVARGSIFIEHELLEQSPLFMFMPVEGSMPFGSHIIVATSDQLIEIVHIADNVDDGSNDDYVIAEYNLDLGDYGEIEAGVIGWFYGKAHSQDLLLVTSNGMEHKAFLFPNLEQALQEETLTPVESYSFPFLESDLYSGSIESGGKNVLFFQTQNQWSLWKASQDAGFEVADGSVRMNVDIPTGITGLVDVIFRPNSVYPIIASVDTDGDSNTVYTAWNSSDGLISISEPELFSIEGYQETNLPPRLFLVRQGDTEFPILVLQPQTNSTEDSRLFKIYELQVQQGLRSQFRQEINGQNFFGPVLEGDTGLFTLDHVEAIGEFNGDGVSDLLFYVTSPEYELGTYTALFGHTTSGIDFFKYYDEQSAGCQR